MKTGRVLNHVKMLTVAALAWLGVFCACGDEKATAEHLGFKVVDSLLGPVKQLNPEGMSFRPPAGFIAVPDSLVLPLESTLTARIPNREGIDLKLVYVSPEHHAGLIASLIPDLFGIADTGTFVPGYRERLLRTYGAANVTIGDYWVDSVYVKNYMVTDSTEVRIQLICLMSGGVAVELQYVTPHGAYPKLLRAFESSIGTLSSRKGGG
jgi:hypothetical protein